MTDLSERFRSLWLHDMMKKAVASYSADDFWVSTGELLILSLWSHCYTEVWLWQATVELLHFHLHFFKNVHACVHTFVHTHTASGLGGPCFDLIYLWALPLPIKDGGGRGPVWELKLFMASFLSKQKIIQLMCVIHIFPSADPGRGVERSKTAFFFIGQGSWSLTQTNSQF